MPTNLDISCFTFLKAVITIRLLSTKARETTLTHTIINFLVLTLRGKKTLWSSKVNPPLKLTRFDRFVKVLYVLISLGRRMDGRISKLSILVVVFLEAIDLILFQRRCVELETAYTKPHTPLIWNLI